MTVPTVTELNEAKQDLDATEEFVNSSSLTFTTRLGGTKMTIDGALFNSAVGTIETYDATETITLQTQWREHSGIVYRPKPSSLPIAPTSPLTTTPSSSDWVVVQDWISRYTQASYASLRTAMTNTVYAASDRVSLTNTGIAGPGTIRQDTVGGAVTDNGGTIITASGGTTSLNEFYWQRGREWQYQNILTLKSRLAEYAIGDTVVLTGFYAAGDCVPLRLRIYPAATFSSGTDGYFEGATLHTGDTGLQAVPVWSGHLHASQIGCVWSDNTTQLSADTNAAKINSASEWLSKNGGGTFWNDGQIDAVLWSGRIAVWSGVKFAQYHKQTKFKAKNSLLTDFIVNQALDAAIADNSKFDAEGVVLAAHRDVSCKLEHCVIDGNRAGQAAAGQYSAVWFNGVDNGSYRYCDVYNGTKHGLEVWGSTSEFEIIRNKVYNQGVSGIMVYKDNFQPQIHRNESHDNGLDAGIGTGIIVDRQSRRAGISYNYCHDNPWDGINVEEGASDGKLIGNICTNNGRYGASHSPGQDDIFTEKLDHLGGTYEDNGSHGILLSGVKNVGVIDCDCNRNTGAGIFADQGVTRSPENITIVGGTFTENQKGISLRNGKIASITNARIGNNDEENIQLTSFSRCTAESNKLFNAYRNNTNASALAASIEVNGTCDRNRIQSNDMWNDSATTGSRWSVWVRAASCTNTRVTDIDSLSMLDATPVADNGTGTILRDNT